LQNNRIADYVFDIDRLTNFEGKTGPYCLYQTVRIKSLIAKAGGVSADINLFTTDHDRGLILALAKFPEAIKGAVRGYAPHILCDHIYNLAQEFSAFYAKTHIMSEENQAQKQSWLGICNLVATQLETALKLLGITVPNRM
jgi:arginyl-tRNA synthetase